MIYETDWTDIEVEPFSEEKREQSLRVLEAKIHSSDVIFAISSLLAWPDERALTILLNAIPAETTRCRNDECARLGFGRSALAAFDDSLLRSHIAPGRLRALCPPEGNCR